MKEKEIEYKIEKKEPMVVRESGAMQYDYQATIPTASIYIEEKNDDTLDAAYEKYVIDALLESKRERENGGKLIDAEEALKMMDSIIEEAFDA